MSRCEHALLWHDANGVATIQSFLPRHHLRCVRCKEMLPIGKANDSPEAVQVKIEAARIARDPQTAPEHGRTGPDGCAACGWAVARFDGNTPTIATAAAGWLAWLIANHDTTEPTP